MNKQNIPWEVISRYLSGEREASMVSELRNWLNESQENKLIFNEIMETWRLTKKVPAYYEPNNELLWKKLMFRIGQQNTNLFAKSKWIRYLAAASIIVLVFLSGIWFQTSVRNTRDLVYTTVKSPGGSKSQIVLPDSTVVWLNSNAEIKYPSFFSKTSRDVYISGECFFEVSKNLRKQFVVHCSELKVKVYGTSFNIKDAKNGQRLEVSLVEGKVQLLDKKDESLCFLKPGEQFAYENHTGQIRRINNIENLSAWKNNVLAFENTPIEEVIQSLESWYGVKIRIDKKISNKHSYTFRVKTESMKEVLDLISVITPIKYELDGEKVTIQYK